MSQSPGAAGGPAEAADPRTDTSSAYRPLPSRRALRAAEREAEKKHAKNAAHRASPQSARPASLDGRRTPITGAIPAVPAQAMQARPAAAVPPIPTRPASANSASTAPGRPGAAALLANPAVQTSKAAAVLQLPEQITAPSEKPSRAGRNLPAAIGVGLALLVVVLIGLLFYPPAFAVMVILASALGVWEVSRALLQRGVVVPIVPIMFSVVAMPVVGYYVGAEGLLFALVACALAVMIWRSLDETPGTGQSIFAGVFLIAWIPFLISFVLLLIRASDGPASALAFRGGWPELGALKVVTVLLLVVASDTFGYLFGALFGKHPMAPKISPKKSWEGFIGSVLGASLIGVLASVFLLREAWWVGVVLAVGIVLAGTTGDLAESMIKRELGVKDMSSILPGHGGLMDRLDSILFAAPAAFMLFSLLDWLQGL